MLNIRQDEQDVQDKKMLMIRLGQLFMI